jgi:hypothetical protein
VVNFQLPAGATGFTILSQGQPGNQAQVTLNKGAQVAPNSPAPSPLKDPSGQIFFDYPVITQQDLDPSSRNLLWSGPISPLTAALTFPNTSAALKLVNTGLSPGSWSLTVNDFLGQCPGFLGCDDPNAGSTASQYDITILTRTGGIPDRGAFDLAIYLVSTDPTLTAAHALTDPQMARAIQRISADLARGGICLGTVTFYDLPDWARTLYHSLPVDDASRRDPCGHYRQLLTLAQPGNTAGLFFLDELTDPSGGISGNITVGVDGSIPGVATISGTIAGGAVVSAADLHDTANCQDAFSVGCGPDATGETAAHELGHALGLFHPSEADGASGESFDSLVDTPQCLCSLCISNPTDRAKCADQPGAGSTPTLVEGLSCVQGTQDCGGGDYLMFWQLNGASKGNLSPQEGQVMRMNPLVRPL